MPIIRKLVKAKAPYRFGVLEAIPRISKVAQKRKETISAPPKKEEVISEIVESTVVPDSAISDEITLEAAGFTVKSIRLLNANEIFTVQQLRASIEAEPDLSKLPKIGKVSGTEIIEELKQWETSQDSI